MLGCKMTLRQHNTSRPPSVSLSEIGQRITVKCGTGVGGNVGRELLLVECTFEHFRPNDASINLNFNRNVITFFGKMLSWSWYWLKYAGLLTISKNGIFFFAGLVIAKWYIKYCYVHCETWWCDWLRRQHICMCQKETNLTIRSTNVKDHNTRLWSMRGPLNCIVPKVIAI